MSENQNQNEQEILKVETQEQINPKVQKVKKQNPVNEETYKELISLWFTRYDGGKLKENFAKRLEALEKEVKNCDGHKSKMTVSAAIGSNVIQLIKDFPVPESIYKTIKEAGSSSYYFGK